MVKISPTIIGVVTAIVIVALSILFFYKMNLPVNGNNQFVIMAVFSLGILWALAKFNRTNPYGRPFKDYFQEGFKTFIVITLLLVVFTYIFYKLNPQILENKIAESNQMVIAEGNHTMQEIEENAQKLRKIFMPMMLSITMFKYLILGVLITVIGGAFFSRPGSNNANTN